MSSAMFITKALEGGLELPNWESSLGNCQPRFKLTDPTSFQFVRLPTVFALQILEGPN